ncbi:MAG: hypothetical protein CMH62_00530 [Nanoarchaeota archaeon]|jgi:hypothetical protein|nr:hypothetical protein [Nanoarchaeota archaeon]|tara:strand:- start:4523 stop:4717 length:195 start_codon:yes stop_codon:yes gene_type:complete
MDNYTTTTTEYSVTIVIDSTNKSAIRAIVRVYFGDNISEDDLNEDGSYTKILNLDEDEIKADLD